MTRSGELAHGRTLASGVATGAVMTIEPLSFWGGLDWHDGRIIDVHHPACGATIAGRVLVMPHGRGSSSAAAVMAEVVRRHTGPVALIVRSAEVILVCGALAAAELYGVHCPVVEVAADAFARVAACDGETVTVTADGDDAVVTLAGAVRARGVADHC
jgi:predicted aconitase with swiveling domain